MSALKNQVLESRKKILMLRRTYQIPYIMSRYLSRSIGEALDFTKELEKTY